MFHAKVRFSCQHLSKEKSDTFDLNDPMRIRKAVGCSALLVGSYLTFSTMPAMTPCVGGSGNGGVPILGSLCDGYHSIGSILGAPDFWKLLYGNPESSQIGTWTLVSMMYTRGFYRFELRLQGGRGREDLQVLWKMCLRLIFAIGLSGSCKTRSSLRAQCPIGCRPTRRSMSLWEMLTASHFIISTLNLPCITPKRTPNPLETNPSSLQDILEPTVDMDMKIYIL